MSLPYITLSVVWFALIAYAAFGGADYGAGIWDLLASGPQADRQHELIDKALGPVWETNHVWLVFLVVGLFSGFPTPFSIIATVLFVPLTLALLGSVLRGAAFVFRTHGLKQKRVLGAWTRVFSISSVLTPFFLGLSAAAVASGGISVVEPAATNLGSLWLTPFCLVIGLMALGICATLAAIYLTVEATDQKQRELAEEFRRRGLVAGGITAALGALGLVLSIYEAPVLWQGMVQRAIPLVITTMVIGLATAAMLYLRYYGIARTLIVAETAFLLGTWGVSQVPFLIPPAITVDEGASSSSTLLLMLIGILIGMSIIIPSIYFLFYVIKLKGTMGFFERAHK